MILTEVKGKELAREFILANVQLNAADPNYIRPLDKDIDEVFDPAKNKALRHAEVTRWIMKNGSGELTGRIAAFVNKKYKNKGDEGLVGGIGFFDCVNSQSAANLLFDKAKSWLSERGVYAIDGPINCGERDKWWGLITEGFKPPGYCMNYNPPYYRELFENYGFKPFYYQICFGLKVPDTLDQKFFDRHQKLSELSGLRAEHVKKSELRKYAVDFATVYNKAWSGHGGLKEIRKEVAVKMFATMKPVMDERIIWYVYHNDDPIAIWINIPDLNEWFKHLNGKFGLLAKLKFLWIKATKKNRRFIGVVFGIVPEWQGKGVDAYIIVEGAKIIQGKRLYEEYEMQWIGDFNPKMINIAASLGTVRSRTLATYRYLMDPSKEFIRHPIIS